MTSLEIVLSIFLALTILLLVKLIKRSKNLQRSLNNRSEYCFNLFKEKSELDSLNSVLKQNHSDSLCMLGEILCQISYQVQSRNLTESELVDKFEVIRFIGSLLKTIREGIDPSEQVKEQFYLSVYKASGRIEGVKIDFINLSRLAVDLFTDDYIERVQKENYEVILN